VTEHMVSTGGISGEQVVATPEENYLFDPLVSRLIAYVFDNQTQKLSYDPLGR